MSDGLRERLVAVAQKCADEWNARHPEGTRVVVRRDSGQRMETKTRSAAAVMGHQAVVWVEGIAACYALSHVEAIDD